MRTTTRTTQENATRRSVEVEGLHHGGAPFPVACSVGPLLVSSGVLGQDPATGALIDEHWVAMFPDPTSRPARHTLVGALPPAFHVQCEVLALATDEETR